MRCMCCKSIKSELKGILGDAEGEVCYLLLPGMNKLMELMKGSAVVHLTIGIYRLNLGEYEEFLVFE